MLRNRMLGGVSPLALFNRPGEDGGAGVDEERNTDELLHEMAAAAFDEAASAAGEPDSVTARDEPAQKPAGAAKPDGGDKGAAKAEQRTDGAETPGDRGDGRAKNGRFAPKPGAADPKAGTDGQQPAAKAGQGAEPAKTGTDIDPAQQPGADAAKTPPPGWSVASKAAWDKLPDAVKGDIAKREAEVSAGFKSFEGLKPFVDRATKSGQTIAQALTAYTGIEDKIRQDFNGGILHIAQNAGLTQHEAAAAFGKLAMRLGFQFQASGDQKPGGSSADQNAGAEPNPDVLQRLLEPVLKPLMQRVDQLDTARRSEVEGQQAQRHTAAASVVEKFRSDPANKFYDNLEPTIFGLLQSGVVKRTGDLAADLKAAYDMACRSDPEVGELLINERAAKAADQRASQDDSAARRARAASRSVTGAPAAGAREPRRASGDSLHSVAAAAYDQVAGRV